MQRVSGRGDVGDCKNTCPVSRHECAFSRREDEITGKYDRRSGRCHGGGADNAYDSDGQAMNWSARAAGNFALPETVERERHRIEHAEEEQIKEQAKGNNWELEITAPVFRPEKMLRMWSLAEDMT